MKFRDAAVGLVVVCVLGVMPWGCAPASDRTDVVVADVAEAAGDVGADLVRDVRPEPGVEVQAEPGPEPLVEPGAEVQAEPGPEPLVEPGAEVQAEPAPEPPVEPVAEVLPEPKPEMPADPGPEPQPDVVAEVAGDTPLDSQEVDTEDPGPAPLLDPTTIPKFVAPMIIPPVMPYESKTAERTEYAIAVRQFEQQVLPAPFPKTTVWGYGRASDPLPGSGLPSTYNFPAFTVEARANEMVRVTWVNGLVDADGHFLPHLLPIDTALHWANPAGPMTDMRGPGGFYHGPVPMVVHLHGSHVPGISDGLPTAWHLPDATDIPAGYHTKGSRYTSVIPAPAGAAVYDYPNDQRAGTLWFHDHSMGMTRLNVYAGPAAFWLLRDDEEDALNLPGPAPRLNDPAGTRYYELPIAIQDRSFREDGSLFYPDSREYFDGYTGPYFPETTVPSIWNPEFFGNTMVVNGQTWPYQEVEPRLYRLRLLDGCLSRFLELTFDRPGLVFHQIGAEGGLLSGAPVTRDRLLLGPAERADVIVDFSGLQPGETVTLLNLGPDEPFGGSHQEEAQESANPLTTGQVMQFRVVAPTGQGNPGVLPATLPTVAPLTTDLPPRVVTLEEEMFMPADVPAEAHIGTNALGPLQYDSPPTETPHVGDTEIWSVLNLTGDAHPIHLHLVMFQVLDRTPFNTEAYVVDRQLFLDLLGPEPDIQDYLQGTPEPADARESGWKDTFISNPGEVTRIIMNFDLVGEWVWHCHLVEHEDNEMMRPLIVLP